MSDDTILRKLARVLDDPSEEELHSWLAVIFTDEEMDYLTEKYST